MRSRLSIILFALIALVGLAFGVRFTWRNIEARSAWRAARPWLPALDTVTPPLRARLAAADARVAAYPPDVAAWGELAQLYPANGYSPQAEQAYRGLLRFDPTNPHWPHLLAALLAGYGRLDDALPLLQRTVVLAPDYLPARLRLADALLKAGRTDEAEQAYNALLQRSPANGYALLGLARIDLARERLTAAREKLTHATAADPKFFGAQSLLASVFEQLGDDAAASAARIRANQAGRFKEALDAWVDGLVEYCYDVYRLQVAAATAKSTGDAAGAVPLLQRALTLAPDDARTLRQLGTCYLELRDFAHAREPLERAVAAAPSESSAWVDLATYQLAIGDTEAAQRTLRSGLARSPDVEPLHAELGALLLRARQLTEAIPHLQEAVRLSPEKPDIARDLITALFEADRSEEAIATLRAALNRNPGYAPLLVQGARLEIKQQNATAAADMIRKATQAGATSGDLARLTSEYRRQFGRSP